MRLFTRITSGLLALLRSRREDAELDEELAAYREAWIADRMRRGMTREEAARAASREIGPVTTVKDRVRAVGWEAIFDDVWQDVRYAVRALRRSPGFASVAILTLALGIGANAAIFSVVNAVLIRPLPFPEADRLVRIFETYTGPLGRPLRPSLPAEDLRLLRSTSKTLSHVDAYGVFVELRLGRDEDVELAGARVSHATLELLDARPTLGRLFDARESADIEPVLVLGHAVWRRHFGADASIIGRTVTVEGTFPSPFGMARQVFTVIGVMAPDFRFPTEQTAFWIPTNLNREGGQGSIAQLNPGVSVDAAAAEIVSIFGPQRPESRFEVVRLQDEYASSIRPALVVLLGAVGVVLLIACANLANLQLARATARHRELALRGALGAGRGRLTRQLMTESMVLALPGGATGILLAFGGIAVLRMLLGGLVTRADLTQVGTDFGRPSALPLIAPQLDLATLLFTFLICLFVGLVSGIAPAFAAPLRDAMKALRQGGASAIASFGLLRRNALRSGLVVAQVTLAIVLLVAGGLLIHSFVRLVTVDPGFEPRNVLTFNLRLPPARSTPAEIARVAPDLVARLRSVPGVSAAGYTFALPTVSLGMGTAFRVSADERFPKLSAGSPPSGVNPGLLLVSEGYTRAVGMRVRAGRDLDDYARSGGRRGILINESLARERFSDVNSVGRPVYLAGDPSPFEVAGVVDDVWTGLERAPGPQVLREFPTGPSPELEMLGTRYYYAVRITRPASAIVPAIRAIVRQIDDQAFLDNLTPLEELLSTSIARPRLYALLLGAFGAAALILATIGIYGVMAYAVSQAVREIGLRMALGAEAGDVVALVLSRAALLTAVGLALGLAGAVAASQYLRGMLFGLTPLDLPTYAAVVLGFSGVAMLAAYVPARRAVRVDPTVALRAE